VTERLEVNFYFAAATDSIGGASLFPTAVSHLSYLIVAFQLVVVKAAG
jgi:hypothetical protein